MRKKPYQLKCGRKFRISELPHPPDADIIYFTSAEWDFIKSQNMLDMEKSALWELKCHDWRYSVIPESEQTKAAENAKAYVPGIIEAIKRVKIG